MLPMRSMMMSIGRSMNAPYLVAPFGDGPSHDLVSLAALVRIPGIAVRASFQRML